MRSAKTDQTAQMRSLISVFADHTSLIVGVSCAGSYPFIPHFVLNTGAAELLIISVLKFSNLFICLKTPGLLTNSIDADQMQSSVAYDVGLHRLQRPVCSNM